MLADEILCKLFQTLGTALCKLALDDEVLALGIAEFLPAFA